MVRRHYIRDLPDAEFGVIGRCVRACLAGLLDLPLKSVPLFKHEAESDEEAWWNTAINDWLAPYGFQIVFVVVSDALFATLRGFYLVTGHSIPDDGWSHTVIYRDGRLWHNPDRDCAEIVVPQLIGILAATDPSAMTKRQPHEQA